MASGEKLEKMNRIFNAFDLGDAMSLIGKDEEFKRVEMEIASATSKARLNNLENILEKLVAISKQELENWGNDV
jgi:hypothetical protein